MYDNINEKTILPDSNNIFMNDADKDYSQDIQTEQFECLQIGYLNEI